MIGKVSNIEAKGKESEANTENAQKEQMLDTQAPPENLSKGESPVNNGGGKNGKKWKQILNEDKKRSVKESSTQTGVCASEICYLGDLIELDILECIDGKRLHVPVSEAAAVVVQPYREI